MDSNKPGDCEQLALVHAYHDGELAPAQRTSVEAHLNECADCRELLADLRRVSELVAAAPLAEMPLQAMKRMQQAWWAAQDRGVLRVASWLTAAAAAVMLAAMIWSSSSPADRGETTTTAAAAASLSSWSWQTAALTPPTEFAADETQESELVTAAQWIANDLAFAERQ